MKNIQLEELTLIKSTQSILKKLIFLYEKDASKEPVALTTDELIERLVLATPDGEDQEKLTWMGLNELTTKVTSLQNWKENEAVSDILSQIATGSEDFQDVLRRLTVLEREILGVEPSEEDPGYDGVLTRLKNLQDSLAAYDKELTKLSEAYEAYVKSNDKKISDLEEKVDNATSAEAVEKAFEGMQWQTI